MEVERVDIDDDAALREWFEPFGEAERFDWPDDAGSVFRDLSLRVRDRLVVESIALSVRDNGGSVAGSVWMRMPIRRNRHLVELMLAVRPECRGRGAGRALLSAATEVALARGHTLIVAATEDPLEKAAGSRNARFATDAGFEKGLIYRRQQLRMPVDPGLRARLGAEIRPAVSGYLIDSWEGGCPDRYLEDRVELARAIARDAPREDLEVAANAWDPERLRRLERGLEQVGRASWTSGVIAPSGRMVGYTQVAVMRELPEVATQFGTVVLPEHRGHRLGMALKLVNLEFLRSESPATERVVTRVAESNAHMLAVNSRLGFETIGVNTYWQQAISAAAGPSGRTDVSVSRRSGKPRRSGRRRARARRR